MSSVAVASTPGLVETLQRERRRAARFYAKFGITGTLLRHGVPAEEVRIDEDLIDQV